LIRSFNGKTPQIANSAFVSEAAYVIGDVHVGEGSGIFPGAVIRGDFASIKIGKNTMVEDNSVIHTGVPMEIGDNVIIGHGAVIHGKRVGDHNLIGNNATILDEAEIGNNCIVAAGCLVPPEMKIPDNTLAKGVPAKITKRDVKRSLQGMEQGVRVYRTLAEQYKKEGL